MKILFALVCFFCSNIYAEEVIDNWNCIAHDATGKEWIGSSNFQRSALNYALQSCKKLSLDPSSCQTSKEDCDAQANGHSTRPLWRCIALDQMAKVWESNLYTKRDDAAIAATAYCQDRSGFPDSCYTNLMTCKNVNIYD